MKVSLDWIREFLDGELPGVADRLSSIGMAVDGIEKVGGDSVLELDVTANRGDCLSHLGVARELAVAYGVETRMPEIGVAEGGPPITDSSNVEITAPDLCARYAARYVSGVTIGPSPEWLIRRLECVGVRAINNVADITNYVLMELGHPLHAFDADTLDECRIVVRRARAGETLKTLDGVERALDPSMLVIADLSRPVAMAGIMGGLATEICPKTTNVLLESAWFDPESVRRTGKQIHLGTEASYRFERGADVEMVQTALDRAARLIVEIAGGAVSRGVIDRYPVPPRRPTLTLSDAKMTARLGARVPAPDVVRILKGLGFDPVVGATDSGQRPLWRVSVPTHRHDMQREEDLIEEVARHYGYDRFPSTLPEYSGQGRHLPHHERAGRILRTLSALGYSEACTIAFGRLEDARTFAPGSEPVVLRNPLSQDAPVMRVSLVPGLLETARRNLNRGARDLSVYEMSKIYPVSGEVERLAMLATGTSVGATVHQTSRDADFFSLKGEVEALLAPFDCDTTPSLESIPHYYHPGRSIRLGDIAVLGELGVSAVESYRLRQRVFVAEIAADRLLAAGLRPVVSRPIPRYPSIRRDLSLLIDRDVTYRDVVAAIRSASIPELIEIFPFDRLEKGTFPEKRYSLAVALTFQSEDRTLTDTEVEEFERGILRELGRISIELRS
jgi:phenylalanyl-tRNA synthetase beta chain